MADASERTRNALRAAHLYYVEDQKMDAIAEQLNDPDLHGGQSRWAPGLERFGCRC